MGLFVVVVVCSASWWDPRTWMSDAIDGLMKRWAGGLAELAEGMLLGAFDGSLGTLSNAEWSIATIFTGRMGAVMGVFAVGFCALEIVAGMVGRDPMRIAKGALIAMLAWPLTATAAWATIKLTAISDSLSMAILSDSPAESVAAKFFAPLQGMLAGTAGVAAAPIIMLVFAVLVLLPTVLLSLVMAFRSFGLLVAVAFAPVALMTQGWAKMRGMARGWATIVGALLVTKPLAAGIIVLSLELIDSLPDVGGLVMGIVGLWMAAFAPVAAASLFNFAGGEIAAAQGAASAQAGRHMVGAGRAVAGATKKAGSQAVGLVAGGGAGVAAGAGGTKAASLLSLGGRAKSADQAPSTNPASGQPAQAQAGGSSSSGAGRAAESSAGTAAPGTAATNQARRTADPGPHTTSPLPAPAPGAGADSGAGPAVAGGRPAPSTHPGAPQTTPAPAHASSSPAAGPGWGGEADGRGAGFVSSAGGFGSTTGIGEVPAQVGTPGGTSTPSPGVVDTLGGAGVTTTAASGAPSAKAGSGSGSGAGPGRGGARTVGGGVSTTGGAPASRSGSGPTSTSGPAVTGAGGVTGSVVDSAVDALGESVEVTTGEDSK